MQAVGRDPKLVKLSIRLYRLLLAAYPAQFRREYGPLMAQVFGDTCRQAASPLALLALWGRTLADYFLSIVEQYTQGGSNMTGSKWIKLSGWLMAASSLLFLLAWLASTRPEYNQYNAASWPADRFINQAFTPLLFLATLCVLFGLLGLRARYGQRSGQLGQAGLVLSVIGAIAALVGEAGTGLTNSSPWWETMLLGMVALFAGLFLFGLKCARLKLLPRWNNLPVLTGIPWPIAIFFDLLFNSALGIPFAMPPAITTILLLAPFAGLALIGYQLQADMVSPSQPAMVS